MFGSKRPVSVPPAFGSVPASVGRRGDSRGVLGEVGPAQRLVVGDLEVAVDTAEVAERERDAWHELLLQAERKLPVVRPHAPAIHDGSVVSGPRNGAAEVRIQVGTAFAIGGTVDQVAVGKEIVVAVGPHTIRRGGDRVRRIVRARDGNRLLLHAPAGAALDRGPACTKQVVGRRHARIDVLPVRHVLNRVEEHVPVGQPAMRAKRKRLGGRVQEVDPDTTAHRQTVQRPPVLREDPEVVVQVVLPARGRRIDVDECRRKGSVGQLIGRVPHASSGVVVVAAPEVAALQFEPDLGVVGSGHVAGRRVDRLARQAVVEIEGRGRPRGVARRLIDDGNAAGRQGSLTRTCPRPAPDRAGSCRGSHRP